MADKRAERLAVLIDADNTSSKIVDGLFDEIARIGEASARRIFGDFSGSRLKGWAEVLNRHAIVPSQSFANTTGKNATDIALVIEAMDLLHSGRFDGFCLVSSDSDFTRLASRIREHGLHAYGFGTQKTPESLRQACNRFIYTENLMPPTAGPDNGVASVPAAARTLYAPSKARPLIQKAMAQLDTEGGWVALGRVGQQLVKLAPDFDTRSYGFAKLSSLVEKSGGFEMETREAGGILVRPKPKGSTT